MKYFLKLILFVAITCEAFSQSKNSTQLNEIVKKNYEAAINKAIEKEYSQAIVLLQQIIETDSNYVDAYLSLAGVYAEIKNHAAAISYFEKAFIKDSARTFFYNLPYAINLAGNGEFEKAIQTLNKYLSNNQHGETARKAGEYRKKCFEFAIEQQKKSLDNSYQFVPINMGDSINSNESEYFPSLTIDGSELVFTRNVGNTNEDFFSSKALNKTWEKAVPLLGNVNTKLNEGAQNISQDGQWLVFTACNRSDSWGGCDIYISYFTKTGWSEAINLGGNINSDQWDSQPCLSPDKKDLYFASRRWGGFGGSDIYVSHLLPNGNWSIPENLGPEINTKGDESSPFIHSDNQTLFFTSNGLVGYGGDDLFLIRKGPNAVWSQLENLGFPINTIHQEGTLFVAANATTAYYSSNKSDSRGGLDIYSFELPKHIRAQKTLWIKGVVFDKKTLQGLPATVELTELETSRLVSTIQTDEKGNYLMTLPVGKNYAFTVNRKNYLFYSDNFLLKQNDSDSAYEKNIALQPIEINAAIILKNIFFDNAKSNLKIESQLELEKIVQLLTLNPSLQIQISGHTDNIGKEIDNNLLSENRANAVVSFLIDKGVSKNRLTSKGFGDTKPIATNETEQGRTQNRRTEMKITAH